MPSIKTLQHNIKSLEGQVELLADELQSTQEQLTIARKNSNMLQKLRSNSEQKCYMYAHFIHAQGLYNTWQSYVEASKEINLQDEGHRGLQEHKERMAAMDAFKEEK